MPTVRVEKLYKVFGRRAREAVRRLEEGAERSSLDLPGVTPAVIDASFEVRPGELFVVMGLSGSGKSTLLRMLNGLLPATSGRVYVDDEDLTSMSGKQIRQLRQRTMSMVFQHFALFPHRTVLENAAYPLEIKGLPRQQRLDTARESLAMVGLTGWENHRPDQLSGGMRQRVGLARALAADTDVLLMDEAFSALDPLIRREMQDQLLSLQSQLSKTIIFITHDLNEAMRLGDRIAVMREGRIVQIGAAEAILTKPADDYVARFVQDVDRSRVLTASSMLVPAFATIDSAAAPQAALQAMREHHSPGVFVVEPDGRLAGVISDSDATDAARRGQDDIREIISTDFASVRPETPVNELFTPAAHSSLPLAVLGDDRRLLGVVPREGLLAALGRLTDAERATESKGLTRMGEQILAEGWHVPRIPLGAWFNDLVDWLNNNVGPLFDAIQTIISGAVDGLTNVLQWPPPWVMCLVLALLAWWLRSWKFGLVALIGFALVDSLEMFGDAMLTLAQVLVSGVIATVIAVPLGILAARSTSASRVIKPVMDFMQTLPAFVYLIPAIIFFSIGAVPGVVATVVFSLPPGVRLTELGIRQVDHEMVEAGESFGAPPRKILSGIQIPLALPSIMAGINQIIMLSLSMVVIAGMVGAPGLGSKVFEAVTPLNVGAGFEYGVGVVILAIYLDRITSSFTGQRRRSPLLRRTAVPA